MVNCHTCGRDVPENHPAGFLRQCATCQNQTNSTSIPQPMDIDDVEVNNVILPEQQRRSRQEPETIRRSKLMRIRRNPRSMVQANNSRATPPEMRRNILAPWERQQQDPVDVPSERFRNLQVGRSSIDAVVVHDVPDSPEVQRQSNRNVATIDMTQQQPTFVPNPLSLSSRNASEVVDLVGDDNEDDVIILEDAMQAEESRATRDNLQVAVSRSNSNGSGDELTLPTGWSCLRCTLNNPNTERYCDACGSRRILSSNHANDTMIRPPDATRTDRLVIDETSLASHDDDNDGDDSFSRAISSRLGYASGGALLGGVLGTTGALLRGRPLMPAAMEGAVSGAVGGVLVREAFDPSVATGNTTTTGSSRALPRPTATRNRSATIENPYRSSRRQPQPTIPDPATAVAVTRRIHSSRRRPGNRRSVRTDITDDPIFELMMALMNRDVMVGQNVDGMSYEDLLQAFGDGTENMGASEELISSLPVEKLTHPERLPEDCRQCYICLEEFQINEERMTLPCLHGFHDVCASKWLLSNGTCPICKHQVNSNSMHN
jgi:Ring finger domain